MLSGLRVLDLTQFLSGPFCTQILGDLGAEVIKVEAPEGDLTRQLPPHFVGGDSVYYLSINRNKKSVVIDLKTEQGRALLLDLAAQCDVLVENFRPGVIERIGVRPDDLLAKCPKLVWCSISGFGQDGPYREFPAYDMIVQAISGGMSLTGEPDGQSVRAGVPIGDLCAGLYAAIGILGSIAGAKAGENAGRKIDISMLDCQVAMLSYQASYFLHSGRAPGRQGRAHDSIPTYNTFKTGDHDIVITANTEKMWQSLCAVLGRKGLPDDPRFRTNADRHKNRAELIPLLQGAFAKAGAEFWVAALREKNVPVAVVNMLDTAFRDPQVVHRKMIQQIVAEDGRRVGVVGNPIKPDNAGNGFSYPPRLGEDTRAVLRDLLGLSEAAIEKLLQARVVAEKRAMA